MLSLHKRIETIPGELKLQKELSSSPISLVFNCIFNNVKAVIRFDLKPASKLAIDRENETMILKKIMHLDLSPKILYSNLKDGILIWEYISGTKVRFNIGNTKKFSLHELGKSLHKVHKTPIHKNSKDIFSNSLSLYNDLLTSPSEKLLMRKALNLFKELSNDKIRNVFSHNDLHRENIIWNKKFYFLDWEYSSLNHPCFDIASIIRNFDLDRDQINDFSNGYKSHHEIFDIDVLKRWIKFIEFLDKIWEISLLKIIKKI